MLIHRSLLITSSVALETIEWLHLPAFALTDGSAFLVKRGLISGREPDGMAQSLSGVSYPQTMRVGDHGLKRAHCKCQRPGELGRDCWQVGEPKRARKTAPHSEGGSFTCNQPRACLGPE